MANHLRRQIRERIAADVTGLVTTGSNVFQARVYPLEDSALPCLLVYSTSEESEILNQGTPRLLSRTLNITIQGVAAETSDVDDKLDLIAKEIETALSADRDINSLAQDSFLTSTEIEINADGAKTVGTLRLNYQIDYRVYDNAPDVAL
jgi:hypothetical protein